MYWNSIAHFLMSNLGLINITNAYMYLTGKKYILTHMILYLTGNCLHHTDKRLYLT